MDNIEVTAAVAKFCAAINDSIGLELRARFEALESTSLPNGFDSVVVRFAETGAFAGSWSSLPGSGGKLAFRIAGWLSLGERAPLRPAAFHEPDQQTINLVLLDDREASLSMRPAHR